MFLYFKNSNPDIPIALVSNKIDLRPIVVNKQIEYVDYDTGWNLAQVRFYTID